MNVLVMLTIKEPDKMLRQIQKTIDAGQRYVGLSTRSPLDETNPRVNAMIEQMGFRKAQSNKPSYISWIDEATDKEVNGEHETDLYDVSAGTGLSAVIKSVEALG